MKKIALIITHAPPLGCFGNSFCNNSINNKNNPSKTLLSTKFNNKVALFEPAIDNQSNNNNLM